MNDTGDDYRDILNQKRFLSEIELWHSSSQPGTDSRAHSRAEQGQNPQFRGGRPASSGALSGGGYERQRAGESTDKGYIDDLRKKTRGLRGSAGGVRCAPRCGGKRLYRRRGTGIELKRNAPGAQPSLITSNHFAARVGQFANLPIGLDWVGEPGLGPALTDAAFHGASAYLLAGLIKQRQLAAGLVKATAQPLALRPGKLRRSGDVIRRVFCLPVHINLPVLKTITVTLGAIVD